MDLGVGLSFDQYLIFRDHISGILKSVFILICINLDALGTVLKYGIPYMYIMTIHLDNIVGCFTDVGRLYHDKSTKTLYKYSHDMLEIKDIRCIH